MLEVGTNDKNPFASVVFVSKTTQKSVLFKMLLSMSKNPKTMQFGTIDNR